MGGDAAKSQIYLHPQYYYIGQFSKFLPRHSRRILSKVSGSELNSQVNVSSGYGTCLGGLQATSFQRPDSQIATVVLNCGDAPVSFKLKDGRRAIRATIPAHSIQTYLFHRAAESVEFV